MKSKFILTAFFCVCGIMPMAAQWQRTPTPNDTLQSVKVLSDGRIALNIYAPQAKKVDIEGDIIPWGKKPDVMKSVSGVWTVTVPPVKAGAYYNPQIEMFARFKMKSSFHKTKRII